MRTHDPDAQLTLMPGCPGVVRADAQRARGGIGEAYRRARARGCVLASEQQLRAQLRSIRDYLRSSDPVELVAAVLLEQAGCQRAPVGPTLFDALPEQER